MNLTTDPWIPALCAQGHRELFSLQNLFASAHQLRDLAAKPHERIALMRLLLCITQAALDGPADETGWQECEPLIQPRVRDYLLKWQKMFELFGEGQRFLLLRNLQPGKETDDGNAATKLDLTLAAGNNSTLFDNGGGADRALPPARSALNLLTFQCFAPCGLIGIAKWNGKATARNVNHAPCTPSSMVHTLVLGQSLLQTLHQNLLTQEAVTDFFGAKRWGLPVWESPVTRVEDKSEVLNATTSYLGRLVPLSRAIRLDDEGFSIVLASGLDYPIFPAFREASATVIKRKEELGVLPASTSRSLWRQLAAVSVKRRANADATCGPIALNHYADARETVLWVGALVTDKAKIEDVVEASYSLPAGIFTESGRAAYEMGVAHAEKLESSLIQAVKIYASTLKVVAPAYDRARQQFWTRAEQHLSALFDLARDTNLAADLPNCPWGKAVKAAAFDAYSQCCPRQSPRQIEAYALGFRKFAFCPSKPSTSIAHE